MDYLELALNLVCSVLENLSQTWFYFAILPWQAYTIFCLDGVSIS